MQQWEGDTQGQIGRLKGPAANPRVIKQLHDS